MPWHGGKTRIGERKKTRTRGFSWRKIADRWNVREGGAEEGRGTQWVAGLSAGLKSESARKEDGGVARRWSIVVIVWARVQHPVSNFTRYSSVARGCRRHVQMDHVTEI